MDNLIVSFTDWNASDVFPSPVSKVDLKDFCFLGDSWNSSQFFDENVLSAYPQMGGPFKFFSMFGSFMAYPDNSFILNKFSHLKGIAEYLVNIGLVDEDTSENLLTVYRNYILKDSLSKGFCIPFLPWVHSVVHKGNNEDSYATLEDFMESYKAICCHETADEWLLVAQRLCQMCQTPFYSKNVLKVSSSFNKNLFSRDPKFLCYCLANGLVPVFREPSLVLYVDNPFSIHYHRMAYASGFMSDVISLKDSNLSLSFVCVPSIYLMGMVYQIEDYFVSSSTRTVTADL
jgi:hypothetical protein